jgi:hypothetical protein
MMQAHNKMMRLHNKLRSLHGDESGNIIVLTVAASLLLVALVWAVIGTGQRVVQKETIQSSADAAAFSAAVIKAKGLNLIAFCNLVLAMLFAIIMLLRIIKYALISTAILLTALCAAQPWACGAATALDNAAGQFANWENQAEQLIKRGMSGLATTERAVARITPVLSLVEAYRVGTDSAYAKNFGKGQLITVSYPLPTQGLPVQDGNCNDLSQHAAHDYGMLAAALVEKLGAMSQSSQQVGQLLSSVVGGLMNPLAGTLCGGSTTIPTQRFSTDCNECRRRGAQSFWSGQRDVVSNGQTGSERHQCNMNSMPSWSCPGIETGPQSCDGDPGMRYRDLTFQSCVVNEQTKVDGSGDWPKPLVLTQDWEQQNKVRAFTVLADSDIDTRRRAVAIAARKRSGAPIGKQLLGMAEAEFFEHNAKHTDGLFHMDWRARLVRFTFSDGDLGGGQAGGAGVPAGAAELVAGIVQGILGGSGTAALQDQFLLH